MTDITESKTYETMGRVSERHSCRLKARYRLLRAVPSMGLYRDQDIYESGWLLNRSHGGVLLEASHYLPEGTRIEINFRSPNGLKTYRAEAVVRWIKKEAQNDFLAGLQFQALHEL